MSARSIARNHARETAREERRSSRRARQAGAGAAAALGVAVAFAPSADAATFQVTNTNDAAAGSLRDAITQANLTAAPDTITFASGVTGTITLTTGVIPIDAAIDIQGPGASVLTVSGNDNSPIFDIDVDTVGAIRDAATISGLTLTRGDGGDGGAIYSFESNLTLNSMVLTDNYASGTGGAIDIESSPVTIADSRLTFNESVSGGGAMYTDGNASLNPEDTVTIRNSVINNNEAANDGGALYFDNATGGNVLITGSELAGNDATGTGGAIEFYGHQGSATVRSSTISGNTAGSNTGGGGIYFDSAYSALDGLLIENSTLSGNSTVGNGGGIYLENSNNEPVTINNSTFAGNAAGSDGTGTGGGLYRDDSTAATTVSSSIFADNTDTGGAPNDIAEEVTPTSPFNSGFSLIENVGTVVVTSTPAGSNLFGVDPQLGPLAANGGPTLTRLPAAVSPVIDVGTANGLSTDQRGFPRTSNVPGTANGAGDGTDMGAVELRVPVTTIDSGPSGATGDDTPQFTFSASDAASFQCSLDGSAFAACSSPFTAPKLADGDHTFDVRAIGVDGPTGPTASQSFTVDKAVKGAKLSGKGTQKQKGNKVKIKVKAGAAEDVKVQVSGSVKVGKKKYAVKKATKSVKAKKTATITVKPKSKSATKKIVKALDAGNKVVASLKAKFTDDAGNKASKKKNIKLK